jgi:YVTN family beta-propeller protein
MRANRTLNGLAWRALVLLLVCGAHAAAQIGGPADTRRAAAEKSAAKAPASASQRMEKEGVAVAFSISSLPGEGRSAGLVAGADALVTFRVTDARTGQPLTGLRPNAWISTRTASHALNDAECRDKIKPLLGGLLSVRPDIDLNSYLLLTLNHDNTVSIINPQVAFSVTKLESLIVLPATGADWTLAPNKEHLYVTLPDASAVAVIDTITRKLVTTIPTGEKTRPMRIALAPDGRHAWVGLDGTPLVVVIDTTSNKLVANIPAGAGLHNIAFTPDGRFAYVTNSAADTVSVIDAQRRTHLTDLAVGKTPVPVAYSAASKQLYVAAINDGHVSVIDPAKQQVIARIPAKRGIVALRFEPSGRFGFAVNQVENKVAVLDAATNTLTGEVEVAKGPDQVAFTSRYAYVRGTASEKVSLIELDNIRRANFAAVDVLAGRAQAGARPEELGVADMIQPTPEGNAAMIANGPDALIYYYVEGMMAPMGTLSNYKRRPRALLLLDRSLSETAPGVYTAPVKLKGAGRFDVPVLLDQPRFVNCFELEVGASPDGREESARVALKAQAVFDGQRFKEGERVTLNFKLSDAATGQPIAGLTDVEVLAFEPPGLWQQRQWAKETAPGAYEVTQVFPRTGLYKVMLRVPSRGVAYADLPATSVPVDARTEPAAPRSPNP